MYQGIWGTICDDGWDDIDATVVCRELGFLNGIRVQLPFQLSFGPMQLTQVECMGNESKLLQCSHNEVGNCSQAAAVWCDGVNGMYLSIIYVCLFNHRTFKECILDSEQ